MSGSGHPQDVPEGRECERWCGESGEEESWGLRLRELAWIRSRNVALQLLNDLCLTGDHPFHQVAHGDQAHHGVILQDGEMAKWRSVMMAMH